MNFYERYINLLFLTCALICENDYKSAKDIVNQKGMMNLLATLM